MKKIIRSKLFYFILVAVIFSTATVFAYDLFANSVEFTPTDSTWKKENGDDITNVDEALNELYKKVKAGNCSISVSNNGILSVSNVDNMKDVIIVKDGRWYGRTIGSTYQLFDSGVFEAIAIDSDATIYKSNKISYTKTTAILFAEGRINTDLTGGFTPNGMSNTSYDLTNGSYLEIYGKPGNYTGIGLYTNYKIDVSAYTKLKVIFSQSDIADSRKTYSFAFGLTDTTVSGNNVESSLVSGKWQYHSNGAVLTNYEAVVDITNYTGQYYFEAVTMWSKVRITSIILE